ncbi:sugar phosphate isomerase/epimerase [Micrococcales bacterium 31B]|nr:sugar phosphate isomerase/epimerase [Micrococcales bacterium 31B]
MEIGFSSYSFAQNLSNGSMTILDVIDWVAENGGAHLELATVSLNPEGRLDATVLLDLANPLVAQIKQHAAERGVVLSNIAIGADFSDPATYADNLALVKKYIDAAEYLGIAKLRHDVLPWGYRTADPARAEALFEVTSRAAKELAQYAAPKGVTTSVENHGMFMNHPDRLLRLHHLVDEPNFGITLDIGNFLCVDASPVAAVKDVLPVASIIHAKDFHIRNRHTKAPGSLETHGEQYIVGAMIGYGDVDLPRVMQVIRAGGYDGYFSIEFEGHEDCLKACKVGLENLKRLWEEAA